MRTVDDPPEIQIDTIDEDQQAMAELLGIDADTAERRWVKHLVIGPDGPYVERCPALIGEWRGQHRIIGRGGDVTAFDLPPINPPPPRQRPNLRIV
jgi:hypothetical protein